jgi:ferredoxin-type protein NapF
MVSSFSRRSVLFARSRRIEGDDAIRPPWAINRSMFEQKCTGCGECVSACPEQILKTDARKLAQVDFSVGECTFCGDCVSVCKDAALVRTDLNVPWSLNVSIDGKCLPFSGVECRICEDQCEPRALRFRLTAGGVSIPQFDDTLCTGCGACVAPCPVDAISILPEATMEGALS